MDSRAVQSLFRGKREQLTFNRIRKPVAIYVESTMHVFTE